MAYKEMNSQSGQHSLDRPKSTHRNAVLMFGLMHRSLKHVAASLRTHVLEQLERLGQSDVFFHSWTSQTVTNPRTGETKVSIDVDDIAKLLPEASGVIEPQNDYDESENWERLFSNNPMRRYTGSEAAARATLMNYVRALESLERVWSHFQQSKEFEYDFITITRPDLRYLQDLRIPVELLHSAGTTRTNEIGPSSGRFPLWTPGFHLWGGLNDRLVLGRPSEVEIWCRRASFAKDAILSGKGWNPETTLMKWLEYNGIPVKMLDFVFQRVRSNGKTAPRDRNLRPTAERTNHHTSVRNAEDFSFAKSQDSNRTMKDRFLILTRGYNQQTMNLQNLLEPLGQVDVVVDCAPGDHSPGADEIEPHSNTVWIPDEDTHGYGGLMSRSGNFPFITAWSRAFVHLERSESSWSGTWLIEDDVAFDADSIWRFVRSTAERGADLSANSIRSRQDNPRWPWWGYSEGYFTEPWHAFQPICRISTRLLDALLRFQREHRRFTFHELLFPSLAKREGMSCLDWSSCPSHREELGIFHYRPMIAAAVYGINHPVKNPRIHTAICRLPTIGSQGNRFHTSGH